MQLFSYERLQQPENTRKLESKLESKLEGFADENEVIASISTINNEVDLKKIKTQVYNTKLNFDQVNRL